MRVHPALKSKLLDSQKMISDLQSQNIAFKGPSRALSWATLSSVILGSSSETSCPSAKSFLVFCFGRPSILGIS
jgi:hypothetical protein